MKTKKEKKNSKKYKKRKTYLRKGDGDDESSQDKSRDNGKNLIFEKEDEEWGDIVRLELGKYNLEIDSEKEPPSDEDNIVEANNDYKNIVSESNTNSKEKTTKKIETTEENNFKF